MNLVASIIGEEVVDAGLLMQWLLPPAELKGRGEEGRRRAVRGKVLCIDEGNIGDAGFELSECSAMGCDVFRGVMLSFPCSSIIVRRGLGRLNEGSIGLGGLPGLLAKIYRPRESIPGEECARAME